MDKYSSRRRSGIEIATKTSQVLENNEQKIEINTEKENVPGQETVFAGSSTEPSNSFEIVNSDSIEDEPVSEDDSDVFLQINDDSMKEMRSRTKKRVNNTVNEPNVGKYSRKRKLEKYTARNAGLSYDTLEGKTVRARKMKELKLCRSKCKEKLTEEEREAIFTEYWALGSRDKRAAYVCSLVESTDPATIRKRTNDPDKEKYRMIKVCRGCFMRTLDETNMFVTLAINFNNTSTTSGLNSIDKRGKNSPGNKKSQEIINEIHRHIQSFPAYESHYTRRKSSKKFLPAYLNLNKMNSLYTGALSNPISRSIYEREFYTLNISFKSPKVDKCHKCDVLAMREKVCTSESELQSIKMERTIHQEAADFAYIQKRVDKENSKSDSSTVCYAFDLQQCLPTPFLNSSVSFYKRQLWTYNLTIHDTMSGHVKCYMWHEAEGARGANQIATCLFKELKGLPTKISKVVLYSDSCGGQNRNSHVSAMFLTLQQQCPHFEQIDHKFMVSGHSHLECDVDHGLIEKKKKSWRCKFRYHMIGINWYVQ